ncbi:hypothetical protein ACIGEZ_33875 [Streptomyces sp. NPDC085481]|uniref:hypothetical protein n=1 Tax=Streptomyces sp. NPDC085481 TaxID=3365727 RepID=UPI0037D78799
MLGKGPQRAEWFVGKRVAAVGVAEGIHRPERLIEQVGGAPVHGWDAGAGGGGQPRRASAVEAAAGTSGAARTWR